MKKLTLILLSFLCLTIYSQDSLQTYVGADLVSKFIWRGQKISNGPCAQPYLSFSKQGFQFVSWSSIPVNGNAEIDLTTSYNIKWFTIGITDYCYVADSGNYFNKNSHYLELQSKINLPLSFDLSGNLFIYNDKSSYIELGWNKYISDLSLRTFIGGSLNAGIYSDKASIVNIGLSVLKHVYNYSLVVELSANPYSNNSFLVLKILL